MLMLTVGGPGAMPTHLGAQSTATHEASDSLAPAALPFGMQRRMDARAAIHLPVGVVDLHNPFPQHGILLTPAAGRPPSPGIESAHRHP